METLTGNARSAIMGLGKTLYGLEFDDMPNNSRSICIMEIDNVSRGIFQDSAIFGADREVFEGVKEILRGDEKRCNGIAGDA